MSILRFFKSTAVLASLFAGSAAVAQTGPGIVDQAQTQVPTSEPVNSTWKPSLTRDGAFDRVPHVSDALDWQPAREIDIMYKKRIWREIDTRERQNLAFRYPGDDQTGGGYFIEILLDAIKRGKIQAYSGLDDRFTQVMTKEQLLETLSGKDDTVRVYNPATDQYEISITKREFNPDAVTKYRIKEDVMFDRNLGRMVTRIIGIAPIIDQYDPNTREFRGTSVLAWIYYPDVREVLAQYEVFNPENDVARMTWDDYFENRFFSSRIIKVSNPFDEFIQQRHNGIEGLYYGQEVAEELFNKEHDMWVY